jgi:lipopolysaccharide export system permease protein
MTILDRYIGREFLLYFILSITVFSSLFFVVDVLQRAARWGVSWNLIQYGLLLLPHIISTIVPMACLIASIFLLNRLSKDSEIIAMYACGISIYRVALTIVIISFAIGISNFFLSDLIVPPALRKSRQVLMEDVKGKSDYHNFKTKGLWYRAKKAVYNISYFSPESALIQGINIYLFDDSFKLVEQIRAKRAVHNENIWTLHEGLSITFVDDFPVAHAFKKREALYIKEKPDDLKEISRLEMMSFRELRTYIKKHKPEGFSTVRHEVNLHATISYILACVVLAFLGIPFAAKNPRRGHMVLSIAGALAIAFFYWICLNAGLSFGYSGLLPPVISAWITNILFGALGFFLINKQQERAA